MWTGLSVSQLLCERHPSESVQNCQIYREWVSFTNLKLAAEYKSPASSSFPAWVSRRGGRRVTSPERAAGGDHAPTSQLAGWRVPSLSRSWGKGCWWLANRGEPQNQPSSPSSAPYVLWEGGGRGADIMVTQVLTSKGFLKTEVKFNCNKKRMWLLLEVINASDGSPSHNMLPEAFSKNSCSYLQQVIFFCYLL